VRLRAPFGRGRAILALYILLALAPLLVLAVKWLAPAFSGDTHTLSWAGPSARTLGLLGDSFLLAATVAILSGILGIGLALWLQQGGLMPRIVRSIYLVPLLIPPYIHALEWMVVAGRRQFLDQKLDFIPGMEDVGFSAYGFWPTALVLTFALFPIVTLLVRRGLETIDPELLDAGRLVERPWRVTWRIVLPLIAPSIMAGIGIVFVLALVEYGVPSILQHNVYIMEVYASFSQDFDPIHAFATTLPLLVPAAVALALSQMWLKRSPLRSRPGNAVNLFIAGWPSPARAFVILCALIWALAAIVPLIVLIARGSSPGILSDAVSPAWPEIRLTILVAAVTGTIAAAIAVPLAAALAWRTGRRWWIVCALPLAVPAPLMGIALIYLWNRPAFDWAYGTWWMFVLAHTARFLPFALFAAASGVRHIDPVLMEAAALPDVGWRRRFFRIRLPLLAPTIGVTWLVVFVLSLGELGASLLITPPGEATLPMRIYNLLHYGATDTVSALSLIVLLTAGAACAFMLIAHKRILGWSR